MPMNKEDLHLTRLAAQAQLVQQPRIIGGGTPMVVADQALSPRDASMIYGEVARFGYSGFTMIPGGAQMASADNMTIIQLTGSGWQFVQDLTRTAFQPALERLGVTIEHFMSKFPGASFAGHQIDLQATWDNVEGGRGDEYLARRFLRSEATRLGDFEGFTNLGSGVRAKATKPSDVPMPPGLQLIGPMQDPIDQFDIRLEPLYGNPSQLWLQVVGTFILPTADTRLVTSRAQLVHGLLWDQLADKITMEVR